MRRTGICIVAAPDDSPLHIVRHVLDLHLQAKSAYFALTAVLRFSKGIPEDQRSVRCTTRRTTRGPMSPV